MSAIRGDVEIAIRAARAAGARRRKREVDDEFIRDAIEMNWRCTHCAAPVIHGHVGSCETAALRREKRLLEILEERSGQG